MPKPRPTNEQLRTQIEIAASQHYPIKPIEERIAASLLGQGRFSERISAEELAVILRSIVYTMFARHKVAGLSFDLVHNVPTMKVNINNSQANVYFIVHIHKPIVAFIKFDYVLINDPVSVGQKLRLKKGSLSVKEHTRRFDLKAKAALTAINIAEIARQEMADLAHVISATLPSQLSNQGVAGRIKKVELTFDDHRLLVCLEGEFEPAPVE